MNPIQKKLEEVPVTPYEGTQLGMALQNFNAALRQWNEIDEETQAPKAPGTVLTIFKVWVGWALFVAASSLAVIVLTAVIR